VVHTLDPARPWDAADVRECCCCRSKAATGKGGVAWQIVHDHLKLVELRQIKESRRVAAPARSITSRSRWT